jgi:prepilin-type N-terminal cleavage/methylation domain-containing protein
MRARPPAPGFTLIELLVVVLILGILASITIFRADSPRRRAAITAMKSDLRSLATAEETYFVDNLTYSNDTGELGFQTSPGVTMTIEATSEGWAASTIHQSAGGHRCALAFGDIAPVAPAIRSGVLECDEGDAP